MFCITGTHTHCHTSNGLLLAALQYYDSYAACGDLFHQLLSLPLFWHGWTTVIMLLWQACQTTYSAVFSHSSTLQLSRPLVFLAEVTPQVVASFHWAHQVQTGSPRQPSSARHSTPVSVWRTVLYRWYAGGREVMVVDLQSAGCPTCYCCWPFSCHCCMSQDLERSSSWCHVCHIFPNISAKACLFWQSCFVTVCVIHYSGPCRFLLRPL